MSGRILFLLKGYPRLSETFIAQEIKALEGRGIPLEIWSLRFPTDKYRHPVHDEIKAKVTYLPEYIYQEPGRVCRGLLRAIRLPGFGRALWQWLKDLTRDPTPNRGRRFGQACVLVAEMPADTVRLHAHFMHTPAAVAYYAHLMAGTPWSCSAHAKDIWTSPEWDKREKLVSLDWLVTCTASGHAHLQTLVDDMAETMYAAPGVGLAATQIGVPLRLFIIDVAVDEDAASDLRVFINPDLVELVGTTSFNEGCLSFPGAREDINRAEKVRVRALDRHGKPFEMMAEGLMAIAVQHENDHLDGKLMIDRLSILRRRLLHRAMIKNGD